MRQVGLAIVAFVAVFVVGCAAPMVTVQSGEKVVCAKCNRVIRSDIQTAKVLQTDAAKFSVREIKETCEECKAKELREQAARDALEEAKRRAQEASDITGSWHANSFGTVITIILDSDHSGQMMESTFQTSYGISWRRTGSTTLYINEKGTEVRCDIKEGGRSFVWNGKSGKLFFER